MSIYIKRLETQYAINDLLLITREVTQFHARHKTTILDKCIPGNTLIKPNLGYYIPYFTDTCKTRNVSSWSEITSNEYEQFHLSLIKMDIDKENLIYQHLYTVTPKHWFSDEFDVAFNRMLDSIPGNFQRESASIAVQEVGYSMKFHVDGGVKSRMHIVLNNHGLDYFYTSDGVCNLEYGGCYLINTSETMHGFMSYSKLPRIHIILDII